MLPEPPQRPARPRVAALAIALALAAAGLAGCDESPPTSPKDPLGAGASANRAAGDSLGAAATRPPRSFFVDPRFGNDANPGTQRKPFKTLAHGLGLAIAGDTMRLAIGVYSAATNGERFTGGTQQVLVPAGVTILGTPAEDFTSQLRGGFVGEVGLNLQSGATVKDLILTGFGGGIRATQGVQMLQNVIMNQNKIGLDLSGSAQATLVGSSVFLTPVPGSQVIGARVWQQAQLTMIGDTITPGLPNCQTAVTGVSLQNSARLTVKDRATFKNISGRALELFGTSRALLTGSATIDRDFSSVSGGCAPGASIATFDSASLTLRRASISSVRGTNSIGIASFSSGPLTLDTASLVGHSGAGLVGKGNFKLFARAVFFRSNMTGLDAIGAPNASITITGSNVTDNIVGIRAPFFRLRNSVVTQNETGIVLSSTSADLGQTTATDPGNNRIFRNTNTGVTFTTAVISGGVGSIFASGNTWQPETQGSDRQGHYLDKPLLDGLDPRASGTNFKLPKSSNFRIQL